MLTIDKIVELRNLNEPITCLWFIGNEQLYGSLLWHSGNPNLSLIIELPDEVGYHFDEIKNPVFRLSEPPLQPNIFGYAQGFGTISLLNCVRFNVSSSHNSIKKTSVFTLVFQPTEVWIGSRFDKSNTDIAVISLCDSRLAGVFGTPGLEDIENYDNRFDAAFSALNNPSKIWLLRAPHLEKFKLGTSEFTIDIRSNIINSWSSTHGISVKSSLDLNLRPEKCCNWAVATDIVIKIEQLISIISLEPFSFEFEMIEFAGQLPAGLVWRLGEDRMKFRPPMRHQTIIDLSNVEIFRIICSKWFSSSEIEQLSRWIFVRALKETDNGLARFVTVSQALEVLGREYGTRDKIPKSAIKDAVIRIRESLEPYFEKTFIDRVAGLVGSSNKSSYRDVLNHMITQAASAHIPQTLHLIPDFCKAAAETRNAVVHMTDNHDGKLSEAFARVNKLSLMLCFWYVVVEIHNIGIEMPEIMRFLFNNRNARHGLPNDILEKSRQFKR